LKSLPDPPQVRSHTIEEKQNLNKKLGTAPDIGEGIRYLPREK